jgi:hypothetical protein
VDLAESGSSGTSVFLVEQDAYAALQIAKSIRKSYLGI